MARVIEACVRCGGAAAAIMTYNYPERAVWVDDLSRVATPGSDYALCAAHADRMSAPVGWTLADRRKAVRLFAPLEVS